MTYQKCEVFLGFYYMQRDLEHLEAKGRGPVRPSDKILKTDLVNRNISMIYKRNNWIL